MIEPIRSEDVKRTLYETLQHFQANEISKCVAVVTIDRLIGRVYGKEDPRPRLWANNVELNGLLQFTRHMMNQKTGKPCESMLDIAVYRGDSDPYVPLCTSEVQLMGETAPSSDRCWYRWALFKLLQVTSPLRVFIARIAAKNCDDLQTGVRSLVTDYTQNYREGDRIFSAVLANSVKKLESVHCLGWLVKDGALRALG